MTLKIQELSHQALGEEELNQSEMELKGWDEMMGMDGRGVGKIRIDMK